MSDLSTKSRAELDTVATERGLDPAAYGNKDALLAALESTVGAENTGGPIAVENLASQAEEDARTANQTQRENGDEFADQWNEFRASGRVPTGYRYTGTRISRVV